MKLIGSYTSPFVRKISVMLLEKGMAFEFVNDPPYEPGSRVVELNPLAKVPVLVADDGAVFYDSRVIAEYLEMLFVAPAFLPVERAAALRIRQVEALADGVTEAAATLFRESKRASEKQDENWILRQRDKLTHGLDALEKLAATIPPMAYDIENYATLGLLSQLLDIADPDKATPDDISNVQNVVWQNIQDARKEGVSLSNRLGAENRASSQRVRQQMRQEW